MSFIMTEERNFTVLLLCEMCTLTKDIWGLEMKIIQGTDYEKEVKNR